MTARPKGGLGRGLSALIPSADESSTASPMEIEVARIHPRPDQPRTRFNPESLQELVDSVKVQGVIVPLIITPRPTGTGYTLVAGERRLRAAKAAGLVAVPCRIIEGLDERGILEISLVENLQREDLNPVELAEGYRRLINDLNYTQQDVAERVGKDRATVANTLRLLALPAPVLDMLVDGRLSAGHARALLSIPSEGDRLALAGRILSKGMTVRDIERIAKNHKSTSARNRVSETDASQRRSELAAKEVAGDLQQELGLPVVIQHKGPGGRLTIRYRSLDDLDRLVALLTNGTRGGG